MKCTAHNRQGKRCGNPPMHGGNVCRMHGGSAPQVKAASARRLLEDIVGPAIIWLQKIIDNPTTPDAVRLAAIKDVLDRTGFKAPTNVNINMNRDALEQEYERLIAEYS